jgi:hypothetical protein
MGRKQTKRQDKESWKERERERATSDVPFQPSTGGLLAQELAWLPLAGCERRSLPCSWAPKHCRESDSLLSVANTTIEERKTLRTTLLIAFLTHAAFHTHHKITRNSASTRYTRGILALQTTLLTGSSLTQHHSLPYSITRNDVCSSITQHQSLPYSITRNNVCTQRSGSLHCGRPRHYKREMGMECASFGVPGIHARDGHGMCQFRRVGNTGFGISRECISIVWWRSAAGCSVRHALRKKWKASWGNWVV